MQLYEINLDSLDKAQQSIIAEEMGIIKGPNLPNWQKFFLLLKVITPLNFQGEAVRFILVSPRYQGVDLNKVQQENCTVGVSRVLPGHDIKIDLEVNPNEIDYFAIGEIKPISDSTVKEKIGEIH